MKHLLYLRYLIRHKWFVALACWRYGLIWQGIVHDWTKFLPSEWFAYVENFYGRGAELRKFVAPNFSARRERGRLQAAFDRAWLRHQHRSPHHWQHWILREDSGAMFPVPMPLPCVFEMLADWEGAGRAITGRRGSPRGWYLANRHNIQLHPETREIVERTLAVIDCEGSAAS